MNVRILVAKVQKKTGKKVLTIENFLSRFCSMTFEEMAMGKPKNGLIVGFLSGGSLSVISTLLWKKGDFVIA